MEFLTWDADDLTGKCDILFDRFCFDEAEVLIDDPDLPAQDRHQRSRHLGDVKPVDDDHAFRRLFLTGDALHQRGFSGSAFSDHEDELSVTYRKCHSSERIRAGLVCLMYIFKTYQSISSCRLPVDISTLAGFFLFFQIRTYHRRQFEKHCVVERS